MNDILVIILYSKFMKILISLAVFNTIQWWFLILFGPPCVSTIYTESTQVNSSIVYTIALVS